MGLDKSACANQSQKLLDDGLTGSYSGPELPFWEVTRAKCIDALGTGCPKTPLLPQSQVTDSVCPEFSLFCMPTKSCFWALRLPELTRT
jgi:hypothetical protein